MPLYEYRCEYCQKDFTQMRRVEERHSPDCTDIHCQAKLAVSLSQPQVFKPFWHPHLDTSGPVWIESKKQMKKECEERGFESPLTIE